ncbi:hypothetical protein CASFOL_030843 [Castilleja foliolosa]|uniref:Uncharacterized protein n=1 Tax=Castilleja foliolosa TaxID=1961234 RepID=A0ABD3C7V3_9LAMI
MDYTEKSVVTFNRSRNSEHAYADIPVNDVCQNLDFNIDNIAINYVSEIEQTQIGENPETSSINCETLDNVVQTGNLVGETVKSLDDAYRLYNDYAFRLGFSVRKGRIKKRIHSKHDKVTLKIIAIILSLYQGLFDDLKYWAPPLKIPPASIILDKLVKLLIT